MLLCTDAEAASVALASGALACPSCHAGRLRPWGHGRERDIRMAGGRRERLRPRRGLCRSCGATHILLPSWAAPRRTGAVGVIARAAALSVLHGTGSARLGAELGVPAATVRGWLRRLRARAAQLRQEATADFGFLAAIIETPEGRDPSPPTPTGSVLGDALAAVAACAHAAIRWHGRADSDLDALIGRFGLAAALTPAPGS
jgi:transposase-like protein